MAQFFQGTGNLFRAYGATSALILIGFLLINYLVKEKAGTSSEDEKTTEAGESALDSGKRQMLSTGGTFDESAFMSPAGTPFIPASRNPATVAAAKSGTNSAFNPTGRSKWTHNSLIRSVYLQA